ncbi:conjugative transposon protein TraN [Chitinophaga sp. 30R24]|uniref:conjugative transposon protein TraN n=1 Tax=Chitinophaga sp. 30R24 TaxID=3248838 RepID=UPI003B90D214
MKRISVLMVLCVILLFNASHAQNVTDSSNVIAKKIEPLTFEVSLNQTSNLIFPYDIKSVDRGISAILVQKAKGAENVLQVKAGKINFPTTNLSIITADGKFYSFLVNYSDHPSTLNLCFYKDYSQDDTKVSLSGMEKNKEFYNKIAPKVLNAKQFLHNSMKEQKILIKLRSIYLAENSMWFTLNIKNRSLINYMPEYVKFIVKDKKKTKRTAIQEKEQSPLFALSYSSIAGNSDSNILLAFPSFTIPKKQQLFIQIGEKSGGRILLLKLNYHTILRAKILKN